MVRPRLPPNAINLDRNPLRLPSHSHHHGDHILSHRFPASFCAVELASELVILVSSSTSFRYALLHSILLSPPPHAPLADSSPLELGPVPLELAPSSRVCVCAGQADLHSPRDDAQG